MDGEGILRTAGAVIEQLPTGQLIGGRWVDSGARRTCTSPTDGRQLCEVAEGTEADVGAAIEAARLAAPAWRATPWNARAKLLREIASMVAAHRDEFAALDVVDAGLPVEGSGFDVDGTVEDLHYFAGLAGEVTGTTLPRSSGGRVSTYREPYGVVARIIPFNHPFRFAAGKVAAPLVTGNTVVLKPSEHTPLSALRFGQLVSDLLPPGVLNVVVGDAQGVGEPLVAHPAVPRIALTGSVPAGRAVLRAAAEHVKHVTLELGGKNPFVVLEGARLEDAAQAAIRGMNLWRTAGQSCQSTSVIHVRPEHREELVDRIAEGLSQLRIGPPQDSSTDVGPLAFEAHQQRVLGHIERARMEGARVRVGGGVPAGLEDGCFVEPTLFDEVGPHFAVAREEIFGPVIAVTEWEDRDDLLASLNAGSLGLTANVWGDREVVEPFVERLEAGLIWINGRGGKPPGTPFGGFKHSGLGKEGSLEELLSYTQEKAVLRP